MALESNRSCGLDSAQKKTAPKGRQLIQTYPKSSGAFWIIVVAAGGNYDTADDGGSGENADKRTAET